MGLLATGATVTFALAEAACYAPELRDCTVACESASECARGQLCGSDRLCAAPEIAGHCPSSPRDGGIMEGHADRSDAPMADASPDAPPGGQLFAVLEIEIDGQGRVTVQDIAICEAAEPQNGSCRFLALVGQPVTAVAHAYPRWRFATWRADVCPAERDHTCTFVPTGTTSIRAKFEKE